MPYFERSTTVQNGHMPTAPEARRAFRTSLRLLMQHKVPFRLCAFCFALGTSFSANAQLTSEERKGVAETLYIGNMAVEDLEYARRLFNDPYRFSLVNLAIDKPLDASDTFLDLHGRIGKASLPQALRIIDKDVFGQTPAGVAKPVVSGTAGGAEDRIKALAVGLGREVVLARKRVESATSKLTPAERKALVNSLPAWAVEEPVKFSFVNGPNVGQTQILALLSKVDLKGIRWAAENLASSVQVYTEALKKATPANWDTRWYVEESGIKISIAGTGDDVHAESDALIIDLGGDDRYTGRPGASIGGASVLIDLSGDDSYQVPDMAMGAGLLGIGIAADMGGHDSFRGKSLSFGSGLAGVGLLLKDGGHDLYDSDTLTQGFGEFGVGLLIDTRGNDHYSTKYNGQGCARTQGVGWLNDRAGSDTYRAGGLILNSPLFADVYYSNAQGYAAGYREDTGGISGGIGLLTDGKGDDFYLGETYSQAASYWFSVGTLYDAEGHDTYRGYHYNQASAMHMCGAYLFDLKGDDSYINNYGATHAVGHDYGVAVLLDRAGNDVYAARDSRPGIASANGLGLFIDAAGEDRYFGPPGVGNPARGSGSLGIFADLSGPDQYREGLADATAALRSAGWSMAYDKETPFQPTEAAAATPERAKPEPGSQARPSDAELETIYRKATQWGVGTAQKEVADNVDRLISIGMPAFEWMVQKKLKGVDRLKQRAFVAVMGALGLEAKKLVAAKVASEDLDESRNALSMSVEGSNKEAASQIPAALKRPHLRRAAARAAGALGSVEAVPDLLPMTMDTADPIAALNATISLAQLKDAGAYSTGEALLKNGSLPIRKAAIGIVTAFPVQALATANNLVADTDERSARIGVEVLAALGTPESLAALGPALKDGRPGVRIQALHAVNGRVPADLSPAVLELRRDPHPIVRAVAQRIELGR